MFDIILFDLDGTLTDPKLGITSCVQHALEAIGQPEPDNDKLIPFIGPPLKEMFMSHCNVDEATGEFLVSKYRERFSTVGMFENEIYDGIKELLTSLKQAGKKIALATSKPQVFSEKILEHFGIKDLFDVIVGSELNGKRTNKADVIKEVIEQFGEEFNVNRAVMVGDRKYDVIGAGEYNIKTIGVTYGYGGTDELTEAGADYIAESVTELKTLLLK